MIGRPKQLQRLVVEKINLQGDLTTPVKEVGNENRGWLWVDWQNSQLLKGSMLDADLVSEA